MLNLIRLILILVSIYYYTIIITEEMSLKERIKKILISIILVLLLRILRGV